MSNTVTSVKGPGAPWGDDDPKMTTYDLTVSGFDGTVFRYLPENASTDKRPKVGDTGSVDTSGKKPKFVPGTGSSGGGGRSPADTRAIQRQHSQEMGIRFVSLCRELGVTVPDANTTTVMEAVKWATDEFEQDIGGGGQVSAMPQESPETAVPSGVSSERAKSIEEGIAAAGMTIPEVKLMLGAAGVSVGDDLHKAIASMTSEQASSVESFVGTKRQMATA